MLRITVMVSGGGTNLQAIIDAIAAGTITNTEIAAVICNKKGAKALERAEKAGVPAIYLSPKQFEQRADYNAALLKTLDEVNTDLVVLAGCLVMIPAEMIEKYHNRIINIHPSLIPAFCGTGYYGLTVHEKALERGVKITGATCHFVNEITDGGPIILQKAVEVQPDDTPESLQLRVMEQAEWVIMPKAIDLIANGKVSVVDDHVVIAE